MSQFLQDLRFAFRMLLKSPGFTFVAVLTLSIGIGLNSAVFSGVHGLLLRPLQGVEEPDRLVQVYRTWPGIEYGSNSIPHYRDLRDRGEAVFDGIAAWTFVTLSLVTWGAEQGGGEVVVGQMASANYFDVLGVEAAVGRTFLPHEAEGVGAHPVVVLSHAGWQGSFGGDPDIVGRTVRVNGMPFEVVGVTPEGFQGAMDIVSPVLWAPLVMQPQLQPSQGDQSESRGSNFLLSIARMKPESGFEVTRQGAEALLAGLAEAYPDEYRGSGILLVPQSEAGIHPMFRNAQVGLSAVLMAVVALLLLIACVNVTNLFLARAEHRRREIGIRLSVGAGRGRIVRQLLTESLLFAGLAGAVGLGFAYGGVALLNGIQPPTDIPLDPGFEISGPVLLFALVTALGTGVLFGLAPALQASKPETVTALKGESAAGPGGGGRLTRGLVVVQSALSVVLLLGAALFLRNLQAAASIDVGFRAENLLNVTLDPGLQGYGRAETETFFQTLAGRLEGRPEVVSAAWADVVPLGFSSQQTGVSVPGYDPGPNEQMSLDFAAVGPGYFETLGVPVRGRGFTAADDSAAQGAIVVNETMARRFWPGREAVGQVVRTRSRERVVVGVAGDGRYRSLGEEPLSFMYLPLAQVFQSHATLHVRTTGDPAAVAPVLRRTVRELDPDMPLFDLRTMESHLGITMLPSRIAAGALGVFGALGLLLSMVGTYGVIAYAVSRQSREIGIRVALGAGRGRVLGMVLGRGMRLSLLGVAVGLAAAIGLAGMVRELLYTGRALDPVAFVGVPLVMVAVALLATWIPARRAAGIDPVRALREE